MGVRAKFQVVSITERGKVKQVRKKEIIAKQVVNKAAAGDLKATGMLFSESRYAEQQAAGAQPGGPEAAAGGSSSTPTSRV